MEIAFAFALALGAMFSLLSLSTVETKRGVILVALISFVLAFILVRYLNLVEVVVKMM